jgi:hypothetical protein
MKVETPDVIRTEIQPPVAVNPRAEGGWRALLHSGDDQHRQSEGGDPLSSTRAASPIACSSDASAFPRMQCFHFARADRSGSPATVRARSVLATQNHWLISAGVAALATHTRPPLWDG